MEEVETAAADTTSEHSSPRHYAPAYQQGHMTTPNYISKMTGKSQSFSDHHHSQPSWEVKSAHDVATRDVDDSFEGCAPPLKRQKMESFGDQSSQMSPETSVHVRRHHGSRPVGIAQPIQLQDTQQTEPSLSSASKEEIELQKQKSSSSLSHSTSAQQHSTSVVNPFNLSAQVQKQSATVAIQSQSSDAFGDHHESTGGVHDIQTDLVTPRDSKSTLNYLDEVYDSDQSQESQRFDKFINESSKSSSTIEKLTLSDTQFESLQDTTSSETSSESTTRFIATYVTPNMKYLDSDVCIESSTNQSDSRSQDSPPVPHHDHQLHHQYDPPRELIPGMPSAELFDTHIMPVHRSGLVEEEEMHHPLAYDVEKDYSGHVSKTRRTRSSSHLPPMQSVESEFEG